MFSYAKRYDCNCPNCYAYINPTLKWQFVLLKQQVLLITLYVFPFSNSLRSCYFVPFVLRRFMCCNSFLSVSILSSVLSMVSLEVCGTPTCLSVLVQDSIVYKIIEYMCIHKTVWSTKCYLFKTCSFLQMFFPDLGFGLSNTWDM